MIARLATLKGAYRMPRWVYKEPSSRFFTSVQRAQVRVLLEAILPGSETNPGATDADAVEYVDRLLAMDAETYYDIPRWRQQYAQGIAVLASVASSRYVGKALETLDADAIFALLKDLSAGTLFGGAPQSWQSDFFVTLRSHAIEGCFADRRWGGNRDNVIWQWYGYPTGPAKQFERGQTATTKPGPDLPADLVPAPADWTPPLSGNTATAAKAPDDPQSATVIPELAEQADEFAVDNIPGTPWVVPGGSDK